MKRIWSKINFPLNLNTQIYVYCDVVVCKSDEAEAARSNAECGEAESRLRRRDVSSGAIHTVRYGPLAIYSFDASYAASSKGRCRL